MTYSFATPTIRTNLVLPTADWLLEYAQYDADFWFYQDGLKGIIRDVFYAAHQPYSRDTRTALLMSVIQDFYHLNDARLESHNEQAREYMRENLPKDLFVIEEVVKSLQVRADQEIQHWVQTPNYLILPHPTQAWQGNNLLVQVNAFEDREDVEFSLSAFVDY